MILFGKELEAANDAFDRERAVVAGLVLDCRVTGTLSRTIEGPFQMQITLDVPDEVLSDWSEARREANS